MNNNEYIRWVESYQINPKIKEQLLRMNESEINDAFSKKIEFGTAGLRGKIGPGSNRMNHYVVAKTTIGYINYLKDKYPNIYERGIAIAYDNRQFSKDFAILVATLFANEKIKVYLFEEMRPTPELSYAIRKLKCLGGVNITASHNPSTDNGYKVYNKDGAQMLPDDVEALVKYINNVKNELDLNLEPNEYAKKHIQFLGNDFDRDFISDALLCSEREITNKRVPIVYTPLHGTGSKIIPSMLEQAGYYDIFCVKPQMIEDENFSTCPSPNPEDIKAFEMGIGYARELGVKYVIATDPDADRVGICIKNTDTEEFKLITGNELGALLLQYILEARHQNSQLRHNSVMIDTIVSSDLAKKIAEKYNLYTLSVLTGFKYIGALMTEFEKSEEFHFEFGYEESLGFVNNGYVRDKDAVGMTLLLVEMISYYESLNKNLLDVLQEIYEEFGYYVNKQISVILDSKTAKEKTNKIMSYFNDHESLEITDFNIKAIYDYNKGYCYKEDEVIKLSLPSSNVLKIELDDSSWIAIRPSGTEPKMKFYVSAVGESREDAKFKIKQLQNYINKVLDKLF